MELFVLYYSNYEIVNMINDFIDGMRDVGVVLVVLMEYFNLGWWIGAFDIERCWVV
jgi:hypothetical protein